MGISFLGCASGSPGAKGDQGDPGVCSTPAYTIIDDPKAEQSRFYARAADSATWTISTKGFGCFECFREHAGITHYQGYLDTALSVNPTVYCIIEAPAGMKSWKDANTGGVSWQISGRYGDNYWYVPTVMWAIINSGLKFYILPQHGFLDADKWPVGTLTFGWAISYVNTDTP